MAVGSIIGPSIVAILPPISLFEIIFYNSLAVIKFGLHHQTLQDLKTLTQNADYIEARHQNLVGMISFDNSKVQ